MTDEFTEDDAGKSVVGPDGERVGVIAAVEDGTAYVEADAGLTDEEKDSLGVDRGDEQTFALERDDVGTVDEMAVRLSPGYRRRYPP